MTEQPAIASPRMWRIVSDRLAVDDEVFIPINKSPRSQEIARQTIAAIESGELASIAANYLAERADTQQPVPCILRVDIGNGITKTMRGHLEAEPDGELSFIPEDSVWFTKAMRDLDDD